jgi:hypothetical protein
MIVIQVENQIIVNSEPGDETEYWALLVAVTEYADNPDQNLPEMLDEVNQFYDLLLTSPIWKEDHIKIIETEDATVINILHGLRWLDEKEDSNDMSVFFITTHGFPLGYELPPFDETDGTDEALASYWFFAYPTMIITDDEINFMLNQLESQGVCMIVDSCYSGGFNDSPGWNKKYNYDSNGIKKEKAITHWIQDFGEDISGQNRIILMASSEEELSYSGEFTPYLIDAMKGYGDTNSDGIITVEEIFNYVTPRAEGQHPTLFDNYPGEFPLFTIEPDNIFENCEGIKTPMVEQFKNLSINQKVCGYVTDSEKENVIEYAYVLLNSNTGGNGSYRATLTDMDGFYFFNATPGLKSIFAQKNGYLKTSPELFYVLENQITWHNITMNPVPNETVVICGFLKHHETNEPLNDSNVLINWWDEDSDSGYQYSTITDNIGFYSINVASGLIRLIFEHENFIKKYIDEIEVHDGQKLWINESLRPLPMNNSVICGYIIDSTTNIPIENSTIYIDWKDIFGNKIYFGAKTDESGFYKKYIAAGEIYIFVYADGFDFTSFGRNDAKADQILWLNVSLEPERIHLGISKPLKAIYISNNRVTPFPNCIIIGDIMVKPSVTDRWFNDMNEEISKIEFYLDNKLMTTIYNEPFIWNWSEKSLGNHIIKIVAYDNNGFSVQKEREVYRIG